MTTPTDSPQAANETAALVAAVLEGLEEGRQHSMELSGGWAVGWKILAGLAALPALLTHLQAAEREAALLSRDFGELRAAYPILVEALEKIRDFDASERLGFVTIDEQATSFLRVQKIAMEALAQNKDTPTPP